MGQNTSWGYTILAETIDENKAHKKSKQHTELLAFLVFAIP
jgi:hypothetical protein